MATQHVKWHLLLNLYREGKTYRWFVSSCCLREIKMSGTCSLFNPFGDPWPSCLLHSYYHTIALISHVSKQCSKFAKLGFNTTWTDNFQMLKLDLEKAEESEFKFPVFIGDHRKGKRIPEKKSTSLSTLKPLTLWIITHCGKFLKRLEYRTTLAASWDPCMQVRK